MKLLIRSWSEFSCGLYGILCTPADETDREKSQVQIAPLDLVSDWKGNGL